VNDELDDLIGDLEASLAAIFIAAMLLLRSGIDFIALTAALRGRDIEAAILALHIDRAVFSGYTLERQSSFAKVGAVVSDGITADKTAFFKRREREARRQPTSRAPDGGDIDLRLPSPDPRATGPTAPAPTTPPGRNPPSPPTLSAPGGGSINFRFDMTNPRAEAKIRTEAASRITGYVDEQVETARRVIADGFQRGEGPETIATDIAGRINPISGKREGGIVGLSDPQVTYVESMRRRLLSGDPHEMIKVLGSFGKDGKWVEGTGQTLRDRRYDASIKKAIREVAAGKPNPLTADRVDEMTAKYSDRLLKRRAEDIARTETAQSVMAARAEATQQAMDKDNLPDEALSKEWRHLGGIRHARDSHLIMNGQKVIGMNTPFFLPDGSIMLHTHDPQGGVKNNANCRCDTAFDLDWSHGL
jgi:hypothetical protein